MLYIVPWTNVFTPKGNFNPENKKSIPPLEKTKLRNSLAAYEGHDADKVSCSCTALRPHPYKELGSQRMHRLKVEEERLEGCRGRVFKKEVRETSVYTCVPSVHPGANMAQCSESNSTTSLDAFAIGHLRSSGRLSCSWIICTQV